jgi:hypothetical protein
VNDNATFETALGKLLSELSVSDNVGPLSLQRRFSLPGEEMSSHYIYFPDFRAANSFHATGDIALSGTPATSCLKYFLFYLSIRDSNSLSYPDTTSDSYCFHH